MPDLNAKYNKRKILFDQITFGVPHILCLLDPVGSSFANTALADSHPGSSDNHAPSGSHPQQDWPFCEKKPAPLPSSFLSPRWSTIQTVTKEMEIIYLGLPGDFNCG